MTDYNDFRNTRYSFTKAILLEFALKSINDGKLNPKSTIKDACDFVDKFIDKYYPIPQDIEE